jgi:hypothetical protein
MKIYLSLFSTILLLASCKSETLQKIIEQGRDKIHSNQDPSRSEIRLGLKEALVVSIEEGAAKLSSKNGFLSNAAVKIFLPKEVQGIQKTLNKVGMGRVSERLTVLLNRAAEDAALKSVPIFKRAIANMTINDVYSVLTGSNDAATEYLKSKTRNQIVDSFKPQITESLRKVGADRLWSEVFSKYNKLPFVEKVNTDLVDYTSQKAVRGLFYTVSKREELMRKNLNTRTTRLIRKVFNYADRLKAQN